MHYFTCRENELYCEELKVSEIAKKIPTPFYLYSSKTIVHHIKVLDEAFKSYPHKICYSVKANSNLAILQLLASYNTYFDIVSSGELFRLQKINIPGSKIVYAGVGKRKDEIEYALKVGIFMFTVESLSELELINKIASKMKKKAQIALRINPDVISFTHSYITTGKKENKFGINISLIKEVFKKIPDFSNLKLIGLHFHLGSQILNVEPFVEALKKILKLIQTFNLKDLKLIDIGGGLGIIYDKEEAIEAKTFAKAILPLIKNTQLTLFLEPGRFIVGNAGILVTKVIYLKISENKKFIIVDAGMNDLVRPAFYNSFHKILPCKVYSNREDIFDIVGPICESGDFFAKDRKIQVPKTGDLLAIIGAGAYGFTMASNYNSRPRCAEIMVKSNKYYVIRQAETYEDLVKGERRIQNGNN